MMGSDVCAPRSEFNSNQSSWALKSCGRAQTITWNGSESRWPASANSWKSLQCPVRRTEPGQIWQGGGGLACQGCLLPLLTIPGAGGCRDGWMQIGSLRGGLHVWSETKIITALLVTMSLALPLDVFFQFPHQPLSPPLSCPLCYCHIILSTTYHDSSRNFQRASINNSE